MLPSSISVRPLTFSVPHTRLLGKLDYYGIRSQMLTWFSSFLLNRYQRVVVNGSVILVRCDLWCPAGHSLRSLLFLLYINDITGNIQSNIRLFADNCIVYRTIRSQHDSCKLQNDISSLLKWAETWQMRFNSKKCHILSISRQCNKVFSCLLPWNRLLKHC